MNECEARKLISLAEDARKSAYAPYSHVTVGAALLCKGGKIYLGANIENAAFSPSVCAERVAFSSAVFAGEREFTAIAVVGGDEGKPHTRAFVPCGVCRQTMAEFCSEDFTVLLAEGEKTVRFTLSELFPHGFGKDFL